MTLSKTIREGSSLVGTTTQGFKAVVANANKVATFMRDRQCLQGTDGRYSPD